MKKYLFLIFFISLASTAWAEKTSWIKGGASFFNNSNICTDNNPWRTALNQNPNGSLTIHDRCTREISKNNFFLQVSPTSFRSKINDSKLGFRFEPWFGYSQTQVDNFETDEVRIPTPNVIFKNNFDNIKVNNIQLGINLFVDYEILPKLTIYGGPTVGYEISKITSEITHRNFVNGVEHKDHFTGHNNTSEWSSNFIYGGEIGAEYRIVKNISVSAFGGLIQHGKMVDTISESNYHLGSEIRAGAGLIYHWN